MNQIAGELALLAARIMSRAKAHARKAKEQGGISGLMCAAEATALGMVAQEMADHARAIEAAQPAPPTNLAPQGQ